MINRNFLRFKLLGLCAAAGLAADGSWAQTPSDAIFTHQYSHTLAYSNYLDFDASTNIQGEGFGYWTWPTDPNKFTAFDSYWFSEGRLESGLCTDIWIAQQTPTPAPDWSLWAETGGFTSGVFQKISDNYNGTVMPRMRLWLESGDMRIRISSSVDANSSASHGAAWVHYDRKYISKASCESTSFPMVSSHLGVVTVIRTGS